MDHIAVKQAERINSYNSTVLQYCGGFPLKCNHLSPKLSPLCNEDSSFFSYVGGLVLCGKLQLGRSSCSFVTLYNMDTSTKLSSTTLIDVLLACGGLAKNPVFIQQHADIIGYPIILPRGSESVLLGAAILGAVAGKNYSTLSEAMKALNGKVVHPSEDPKVKNYHMPNTASSVNFMSSSCLIV